jgi:hypothetical protein
VLIARAQKPWQIGHATGSSARALGRSSSISISQSEHS